jgi:hypothetical protein
MIPLWATGKFTNAWKGLQAEKMNVVEARSEKPPNVTCTDVKDYIQQRIRDNPKN